jgi:phage terminase large subunit
LALDDLKELDPQKYNRMVLGKWAAYDDAIFNNFDRTKHVKNTNKEYRTVVWDKILIGFDFGQKHPSGILVAGKYGDQIVILEEFRKSMCLLDTIKDQISEYCDKYQQYGRPTIYYDPSCLLIANELENMGLVVDKADNTVDMGIAKVRSMFASEQLIIDESCIKLISELENYRYIEGTEKPIKEEDDLVDPLRYIVQSSSQKNITAKASVISLDDISDTDDDTF